MRDDSSINLNKISYIFTECFGSWMAASSQTCQSRAKKHRRIVFIPATASQQHNGSIQLLTKDSPRFEL